MKKPSQKKRPLRSRMGRRARAKKARLQQEVAAQRRLDKIADGWKPPTEAEKDERIAEKQVAAQDRVAAAEKRRKDRQRRKEVEVKERISLLSRIAGFLSGKTVDNDARIKAAEERRKKKLAKKKSQQERREERARQREEASRLGQ